MYSGKKELTIATIVGKELLTEKLSVEERDLLQEWLLIPENQDYYNRVVNFETLKSKESFYATVDAVAAYNGAKKKIDKKNNASIIPLYKYKRVLKYAAVFLVLLSIAIPFYQNKKVEESTKEKRVVVSSILPKYNSPTLILADGTVVSLEPKKEKIVSKNGIITNVNQVLAYNTETSEETSPSAENTLLVPVGGIYAVNLSDGTKVWLNSKSSLKYPVRFSGDKRTVTLEGEAYFEVEKNPKQPFVVQTQTANVTVLGTHFNVSSYDDDALFKTTLLEGSVQLNSKNPKVNPVILAPGEKGSLLREGGSTIAVKTTNVYQDTAWKEGEFYFKKEKLGAIIKKIERWYSVDFVFEDPSIANYIFTGVARKDKPIEYLLNIISQTSKVTFEITKTDKTKKKVILIKRKQF